jgi:excisionase family DNA binding protein
MKTPIIPVDNRERWLNTSDIAGRLGIRPRTAALWARQGRLPAYRLGRYLRFKWDEVERALTATCKIGGKND